MTVERVRKYFEQFALNDRIKMFTRPPAISMLLSVYLWTSWKNILEQLAGLMLQKK
ncbi:hypothetical protein [Oenococcus oeni]|uniref:hypothetical protein n=1 Tax=Oenococcus oeni TaxID=1247 RepID=UPI000B144816|nr:hypothetical protein [Oenococcus oeni]